MRAVVMLIVLLASLMPSPAAAAVCDFKLGFKAIADQIPSVVGGCLEDEHANSANGDALQKTAGGLLVWRKADNFTAFTDGYRSWVNGPFGLQQRLNTESFSWEAAPAPAAAPPPAAVLPPVAAPTPAAPPPRPSVTLNGVEISDIRTGWGLDNQQRPRPWIAFSVTNRTGQALGLYDRGGDALFYSAVFVDTAHRQSFDGLGAAVVGISGLRPGFNVPVSVWSEGAWPVGMLSASAPPITVELYQGNVVSGVRRPVGTYQIE